MVQRETGINIQREAEGHRQRSASDDSWSALRRSVVESKEDAILAQEFTRAQDRLLNRLQIHAESRFLAVPVIERRAHVLVAGEGSPVVMVIGANIPAAMWAPLMAQLKGFTLYAVDLPGFGLTDPTSYTTAGLRRLAGRFLEQVLDELGLDQPAFVSQSMVQIGCPALILGTSAPLPLRLLSIPPLGRLSLGLQPPSPRQVDRVAAMVNEDLSGLAELREVLLACEKLPTYERAWIELHHAALNMRGARPEVALAAAQLAQLRQPVQMIWGERDPYGSPAVGVRAATIIPNARLHIVPGGHAPWFTGAEQMGHIVAPFLRKHGEVGL